MRTGLGDPAALQHLALFSDLPFPRLIGPNKASVSRRPRMGVFVRWNQDATLAHLHAMNGEICRDKNWNGDSAGPYLQWIVLDVTSFRNLNSKVA